MYITKAMTVTEAHEVKKLGFSIKCVDGTFYAIDHIHKVHLENYASKEELREKFKRKFEEIQKKKELQRNMSSSFSRDNKESQQQQYGHYSIEVGNLPVKINLTIEVKAANSDGWERYTE